MFDAQSLLGGLLKEVTSGGKSGTSLGSKAALGMGALGIAIAAFEHFTENNKQNSSANTGNRPPAPAAQQTIPTPPSTSAGNSAGNSAAAPPPPPVSSTIVPPAPAAEKDTGALLLIDAMLAAANADGHIDEQEQEKIFQQLKAINSDQEGFSYVQQRIEQPPSIEQICQQARDADIARQVYTVSLLAITVDTSAEQNYINQLASCLPLSNAVITQLNDQFLTKE